MPAYTAPLCDHLYCLYDLFGFEAHTTLPGFDGFTRDVIEAVLEQSSRFAAEVLSPLNRPADEEGVRLEQGQVVTPRGFKEAYRALVDGGWPALSADARDGGQGLPHMINFLFEEMMNAACLSFGLFPGLNRGAYVAIARHGSEAQRQLYATRLASGAWAGAMCLTEAHCGTDLGLLRTKAEPRGDGTYAITGTKIFISAGDHDLTPNIVYLVLARLPDAPKGTRGISLFVVSKFMTGADGTPCGRNGVSCAAIEEKMGIHASPTCVLSFDGAAGELVGEPNEGLKAMFAMMNTERIAVGIQGLAVAEASRQNAVAYARQRLQGRAATGVKAPELAADPIIVHADVRRMLMTQKALVEGSRMLALWAAQMLDVSERHADPAARRAAFDFVQLMTPVVKSFLTDVGSEAANLGVQILGGHGYIRGNGQEQFVRDVRVTQIYEGTNGIQAHDLLGRKVLQLDLIGSFTRPVKEFIAGVSQGDALDEFVAPLSEALGRLESVTMLLRQRGLRDPDEIGAAAVDYMRLFALTALGFLWAKAVAVSLPRGNDAFHRAKIATARFFIARVLPQAASLHTAIVTGAAPVMELDESMF